ncbi:Src substrate cortactin [Merluccius polli]|uniref:Src substrate cortactin n=1 Tax=Merluccius polli TaxID=89951 RepID=A0AA47NQM5_MERPO|nr:Src substrate cortactin [Merluccius polli]
MWKSAVGHDVSMKVAAEPDDWETDPDFENDVSEQEQRWGAKTIEGSGHKEPISVAELRQTVSQEHQQVKEREWAQAPKASYGYGGKFGVERDRMDKGAMGHDFVAQVERHSSQTDAAQGFGGKFGIQKDRVDKSALGFEHKEELEQHTSQKDYSKGFGGKYGVEKERVDRTALGYDYKGETERHQSQKDYAKGFGGKFGVDKDNVDKAAVGYDYKGETEKHQSQKDYSKGFGGRYGVQTDRIDKGASSFTDMEKPTSAYTKTQPVEASSAGAGKLKARFENMAKESDEENKRRVEEERERRQAREEKERLETQRRQQVETDREEKEREKEREREEEKEQEEREQEETQRREQVMAVMLLLFLHFVLQILVVFKDAGERDREELEHPSYPPTLPDVVPQPELGSSEVHQPLPWRLQEEPESKEEEEPIYDEPPCSEDFLDSSHPIPFPQEDEGDYEDIDAPPPTAHDSEDYEDLTCGQTAKALYSYQGEANDEISFEVDDIITNIEMVDEGWWKGYCGGRNGLFPAAYVQLSQ